MRVLKGVDIYHGNKITDWEKLKELDFVILKMGGNEKTGVPYFIDSTFRQRYEKLKEMGIPVGGYFFVSKNFYEPKQLQNCKDGILACVRGKQFEYPIAIDIEYPKAATKKQNTDAAIELCEFIQSLGGYAAIYTSTGLGKSILDFDRLRAYDFWLARWSNKRPENVGVSSGMWQYGVNSSVPGFSGNIDGDYAYYDYPSIMKNKNLNDFSNL